MASKTITTYWIKSGKYNNLRTVVEGTLVAAQKVLQEMRARYEQGTALQNDITRYELLVSNLELQLVRINNTINILNTNLVTTAGLLGANILKTNTDIAGVPPGQLYGMVQTQALVVSMKEIYGWLLIVSLASLLIILLSYSSLRPFAIFPKWSSIRRTIKHIVRTDKKL